MGRGFGRGMKVSIVTHSQSKIKGKKMPRGLRGTRQKKRDRHQKQNDSQAELEQSLGLDQSRPKGTPRTLAQDIASISVPHCMNKRQKGLKSLRRQIVAAAKDVRRRHADKGKSRNLKERARKAATSKRAKQNGAEEKDE